MRRSVQSLLVLLAVAIPVGLAGCVSTPEVSPASATGAVNDGLDWATKALTTDTNGHSHRNWEQHVGLSTPNFHELAHDSLGIKAFEDKSAGGYFCGGSATTPEGRRLTIISSFDTKVAFVVVDTTDPGNPVHLGDYMLDNAQTYDVDITPDGKHVVIAADVGPGQKEPPSAAPAIAGVATPIQPMVTLHPAFRDACTGEIRAAGPDQTFAAGPSTILVSLADPKSPAFEDLVPAPVIGPHSVSTAIIDNVTYVASSITNLVHQSSYYQFFQLEALPTGTKLMPLSVFDAGAAGNPTATFNGHVDAEINKNPVTGKMQVYLSDWDGGIILLDFTNPRAPLPLSTWQDKGADGGAVHSTRSIEGVHNGRHYFLAGQEFVQHPSDRPSGWIYILDDTDPSKIKEVGRWTLPIDTQKDWTTQSPKPGSAVELYSTHYFRVMNETVFVAMYHGGLWAFKLDYAHPENMKEPLSVGVFVPDKGADKGRAPKGGYDYAPFVLDVFPYDGGNVVVYDGLSGVYSLHYDETKPMTSPKPWPATGQAG